MLTSKFQCYSPQSLYIFSLYLFLSVTIKNNCKINLKLKYLSHFFFRCFSCASHVPLWPCADRSPRVTWTQLLPTKSLRTATSSTSMFRRLRNTSSAGTEEIRIITSPDMSRTRTTDSGLG
jgi:hypothetical protein